MASLPISVKQNVFISVCQMRVHPLWCCGADAFIGISVGDGAGEGSWMVMTSSMDCLLSLLTVE